MKVESTVIAFVGLLVVTSNVQAGSRYRRNLPPTISGSPATTVTVGSAYSFTPVASDRDRDRLRFYVANKPAWATFSNSTGKLTGTPTAAQVAIYPNIRIYVSDGKTNTFLPTFSVTVISSGNTTGSTGGASTTANHAPVISGTPSTTVVSGTPYSFQPSVTDVDGDMLSFSVSGKPAWATFSISNGSLVGTPATAQVGSYGGIVISVSDGNVSNALPAFGISVTAPPSSGMATLSWSAPTLNTDGTALTNLGGYRIYHGTDAQNLADVRTIDSPGTTSFEFSSLAAGTHYFAISAYNTAGVESVLSTVGSKAIP